MSSYTFGLAKNTSTRCQHGIDTPATCPFDGVLGLAMNAHLFPDAPIDSLTNLLIAKKGGGVQLARSIFTLYMKGSNNADVKGAEGGRLTFGDEDHENCGEVLGWAPIPQSKSFRDRGLYVAFSFSPLS